MNMIEVQNLTKYFGSVLAVDNVTFQVKKGEVVGFLGPNGAGKSTTMRMLTTYIPATSGVARIGGLDVMNDSLKVRENLGYLPENVPLYPDMRVSEYLNFRSKLKRVERSKRRSRMDYSIDRCQLRGVQRRLIGTLSRGYRQRVGLAEALLSDPPLLIMDEPTAGLDPIQQEETLKLIRELGQQHTVMLSTHILPEVEETCKRVIIISQGQLSFDENIENIQKDVNVIIEAKTTAASLIDALKPLPGVDHVKDLGEISGDPSFATVEVVQKEGEDTRDSIARRINEKAWPLRRLEQKRTSLRDVFIRITTKRSSSAA